MLLKGLRSWVDLRLPFLWLLVLESSFLLALLCFAYWLMYLWWRLFGTVLSIFRLSLCSWWPVKLTGTCFIQKIYAPSSSLLQDKHLPFTPSPLRLNIFRLFVILSLTQLYRYTPEIFLFSTATFKYKYRAPLSNELDKNIQRKSHFLFFSHWNGYSHFRSVLNWFRN